ncbi:MAG: ATP-binding protein [Candidatus Omnitrophica bacterium]|nr:ATP-binding protein [Candidatus Omnitrophota bacterium]
MSRITVAAKIDSLPLLLAFVKKEAAGAGFDEKTSNQVQLAFEEAVVNVINYAYPAAEGSIDVEASEGAEGLTIVISDTGIPFDPLSMPEPNINAPLEERRIGGLGVYMFRRIMDKVAYKREGGRNILTLIKNK